MVDQELSSRIRRALSAERLFSVIVIERWPRAGDRMEGRLSHGFVQRVRPAAGEGNLPQVNQDPTG
jgi:hypothetical protein